MVHKPDHVRVTFRAAAMAFASWQDGPVPTVRHDGRPVSLWEACGLVVQCTDAMPAAEFHALVTAGLVIKRRTYAACARALRRALRARAGTERRDAA